MSFLAMYLTSVGTEVPREKRRPMIAPLGLLRPVEKMKFRIECQEMSEFVRYHPI
jgi:hypothetical protein